MSDRKKQSKTNMPAIYNQSKSSNQSIKKARKPFESEKDSDKWRTAVAGQVLGQSGSVIDSTRDTWLNSLKRDSKQFLDDQTGGDRKKIEQEQLNKQAIEITTDRIFSCLQGFTYEFNKVVAGTDLHVSGTLYGDVKEVLQLNRFREAEKTQTYFRANLSTHLYTLIIRGGTTLVECFLMPVNHAMALSQLEKEYDPLATIEIKVNDDGIVWRSLADEPRFNSLDDLCAWLFQELIEQTRNAIALRARSSS